MAEFIDVCNRGDVHTSDTKGFMEFWCSRCRRPDCDLAGWGTDLFGQRANTAMGRLFDNVQRADPRLPQYAMIAQLDFPNLVERAMKLEISSQRGDWSVPEILIADGRIIHAEPDTTTHVDEAIRRLAEAQGQEAPHLPTPEPFPVEEEGEGPKTVADQDEFSTARGSENPEKVVTPGDDRGSQAIPLAPGPSPVDEDPAHHAAPQHPKAQRPVKPKRGNTEMPSELMIGDAPVKAVPAADPWAAPSRDHTKRVKPGATIRFGAGGKIDD